MGYPGPTHDNVSQKIDVSGVIFIYLCMIEEPRSPVSEFATVHFQLRHIASDTKNKSYKDNVPKDSRTATKEEKKLFGRGISYVLSLVGSRIPKRPGKLPRYVKNQTA